ncbi:MAG: hypothetical protein Q9208_002746 [Pyrenodesmia sp. 3 TL-2023]
MGSSSIVSAFSGAVVTDSHVTSDYVLRVFCGPSASTTPGPTASVSLTGPVNPPSAPTPPAISPAAQTLFDELRNAILYVSLIVNDDNSAKLCSIISPSSLLNNTVIKGIAVRNEVCAAAHVQQYIRGVDRVALCKLIDETLLNNLFIGYVEGTGTAVKKYIYGGT